MIGWITSDWAIEQIEDENPEPGKPRGRARVPWPALIIDPGFVSPTGFPKAYSFSAIADGPEWAQHDNAWLAANSFCFCLVHGIDWTPLETASEPLEILVGTVADGDKLNTLDRALSVQLPSAADRVILRATMARRGVPANQVPRDDEPVGFHFLEIARRLRPELTPGQLRSMTVRGF